MAIATLTRSVTVLHDNITLAAGAADTVSTSVALGTKHSALVTIKITNGATGPTVPAQVQVQCSGDNVNWYDVHGALKAASANAGVYSWLIALPPEALYVRTVSGSNTAQNVTLRVAINFIDSATIA